MENDGVTPDLRALLEASKVASEDEARRMLAVLKSDAVAGSSPRVENAPRSPVPNKPLDRS